MNLPLSLINGNTQLNPPASNTAPASLVQMSSSTFTHCSAKSLLVLDDNSATTNRLQMARTAPSIATILRVHSAETSR